MIKTVCVTVERHYLSVSLLLIQSSPFRIVFSSIFVYRYIYMFIYMENVVLFYLFQIMLGLKVLLEFYFAFAFYRFSFYELYEQNNVY